MLKLYGPVFEWRADFGDGRMKHGTAGPAEDRKAPTTASQILFLLDNIRSLKGVHSDAPCGAADPNAL